MAMQSQKYFPTFLIVASYLIGIIEFNLWHSLTLSELCDMFFLERRWCVPGA